MSTEPSTLADLLAYLGEIGYGDFYLPARAQAAVPAGPAGSAAVTEELRARPSRRGPQPRPTVQEGLLRPEAGRAFVAPAQAAAAGGGEGPAVGGKGEDLAPLPAGGAGEQPAQLAQLAQIAAEVAGCRRCRLCEGRRQTVFGSGHPGAELMFIGEGPGAEEDRQGLPFVGPAGQLLTRMIQAIERSRDEVYIANIVKCRPPGNRDPQPDEVTACFGYLERQIALVRPRVLVALGRIAAQVLLGTGRPIGQLRGQWYEVFETPMMVTYHPAALLRNSALKRPTWEDLQQVRDRLAGTGRSDRD